MKKKFLTKQFLSFLVFSFVFINGYVFVFANEPSLSENTITKNESLIEENKPIDTNIETIVKNPILETSNEVSNNIEDKKIIEQILPEDTNQQDAIETIESEYMKLRNSKIEELKQKYPNLGLIKESNLNIYETPDSSSPIVGTSVNNTLCVISENNNGWTKIISNEVVGYIQNDKVINSEDIYISLFLGELEKDPTTITVVSKKVKVKDAPNGKTIQSIKRGESYELLLDDKDFVQIKLSNELTGYVEKGYVAIEEGNLTIPFGNQNAMNYDYAEKIYQVKTSYDGSNSQNKVFNSLEIQEERTNIVEYAKQFIGNSYVWGGTSLTNGADCSGYVQSIFKKFGYYLPRTASEQSRIGIDIEKEDLQVGDLVFYPRDEFPVGHVGIYIGNGQIVNALNSNRGIVICDMNYNTPVGFKRIIG